MAKEEIKQLQNKRKKLISQQKQGIEQIPTIHLGMSAT